jgi:hypothetical protein
MKKMQTSLRSLVVIAVLLGSALVSQSGDAAARRQTATQRHEIVLATRGIQVGNALV